MSTGTVVGFDTDRRFGFIRLDGLNSADIFFHASAVENAAELAQGQRVIFEIINDDRRGKPRADRVKLMR